MGAGAGVRVREDDKLFEGVLEELWEGTTGDRDTDLETDDVTLGAAVILTDAVIDAVILTDGVTDGGIGLTLSDDVRLRVGLSDFDILAGVRDLVSVGDDVRDFDSVRDFVNDLVELLVRVGDRVRDRYRDVASCRAVSSDSSSDSDSPPAYRSLAAGTLCC